MTNGINNSINGIPFFYGAGKAGMMGAVSGAISFGIGSLATNTFGVLTTKGKALFEAGMHGLSGGLMGEVQGGTFISGFAAGAVSSLVSSSIEATGESGGVGCVNGHDVALPNDFGASAGFKAIMVASGGLSGGLSSTIAGGNFVDGMRQGLITSGLNHLAHSVLDAVEENSAFLKRFHKYRPIANERIPLESRNIETVNDVISDVDGLSEMKNRFNNPKILIPNENSRMPAFTDDSGTEITLYHGAFESYYRLASTLFHEFWHAGQYQNIILGRDYAEKRFNETIWRKGDYENDPLKWLEMNAYKTQMNMGDMSVEGEFIRRYNSLFNIK